MSTAKRPTRLGKSPVGRRPVIDTEAERVRNGVTHGGKREGAGRIGEGRTVVIQLRVTPDEREWIDTLATRHGMTVSEWIRRRALLDIPTPEEIVTGLEELSYDGTTAEEQRRIGRLAADLRAWLGEDRG